MRDSGFVIRAVGAGVAAAFALHQAQAGERKPSVVQTHHVGASVHRVTLVAPAQSGRGPDLPKTSRKDVTIQRDDFGASRNATRAEFSFVAVTPLGTDAGNQGRPRQGDRMPKETGPATSPAERKNITLFRLDSKLGDVSVQPVVGGVNGAQLLVGF